ncbi:MAG: hypothetical protein KDH17_22655 [Rhodocyclaceae bacterium]|nr:hypothetical protein [Rhodocyclaceae bacterium]
MTQTMSLPMDGVDRDRRWYIGADVPADDSTANQVIDALRREAIPNAFAPLTDAGIGLALAEFARRKRHWLPSLSLAFWSMVLGDSMAARQLTEARNQLVRYSRYGSGKAPLDFEVALMARIDTLSSRLGKPDCVELCRNDAEEHARALGLPGVAWPEQWPGSVCGFPI